MEKPFYAFLQINADAVLGFLHQLVDFATERWVRYARGRRDTDPPTISVTLSDGTLRAYAGRYWVFAWSHENSLSIGQIHCALAALERWLCDLVDAGADIEARIETLLKTTNSVMLGVLVNVGKHKPELFKGPPRPLLGALEMFEWDDSRVRAHATSFDAGAWARKGDFVFEMAKTWGLAPYRQTRLREIVSRLILCDRDIAEFVLACTSQWTAPVTEKEKLELKILLSELDYRNYTEGVDPATGRQGFEFKYPPDVAAEITAFQNDNARLVEALTFPQRCRRFLNGTALLNSADAERIASLMAAVDGEEKVDVDDEMRQAPRVAAAAVLLLRGRDWLVNHAEVATRAQLILDTAFTEISDEEMEIGSRTLDCRGIWKKRRSGVAAANQRR